MKRLSLLISLLLAVMLAWANPVSYETAVKVAERFAALQNISVTENSLVNLSPENTFRQMYVFGFTNTKGFVIVAADDRVIPILGYSTVSYFPSSDIPEHVMEWLQDYNDQIDSLIANGVEASSEVQVQWNSLLDQESTALTSTTNIVGPLMTTTWNQSPYYNNLCPSISGVKTVAGCVATAMTQVMKYWNHPSSGRGTHSYTWNGQTLSADFQNTTYDWANMPVSLNSTSSFTEVNAIATLTYHAGVAIEMDYGLSSTGGSSAYTHYDDISVPSAATALQTYFKYSNNIRSLRYADCTDSLWKSILKSELNAGRVMLYDGSDSEGGHCFVCDGYDSRDYFHINWGWGGSYDAFYAIGSLNPGSGGTGGNTTYTFNIDNSVVIGIEPLAEPVSTQTVVTVASSDPAMGYVSGAGTYNQYDTITLLASAYDGYIFDRWDDNDMTNPRYVVATSPSFDRTAHFRALFSDTLSYCGNEWYTSMGSSTGVCQWGIRFPASALDPDRRLSSVMLMLYETGYYNLKLYQGDSNQMSLVYTQQFNSNITQQWFELPLTSPYQYDTTRSLWITLEYTASGFPMMFSSFYGGNGNGMMSYASASGTWVSLNDKGRYGSWLIKGVTEDNSTPPAPVDTVFLTGHEFITASDTSYNITQYGLRTDEGTFYFTIHGTDAILNHLYTIDELETGYTFLDKYGNYYSYSDATFMRTGDRSFTATATCEDGNTYKIDIAPIPPIYDPVDTIVVTVSDNIAGIRMEDNVQSDGTFYFYGPSNDGAYTAYCSFHNVSSLIGTHPLSEVDLTLTRLYGSDDNLISFNNMLGDATVSLNGTVYTFAMNFVDNNGVLYQITVQYHDPIASSVQIISATNLEFDFSEWDETKSEKTFTAMCSNSDYLYYATITTTGQSYNGSYTKADMTAHIYDPDTYDLLYEGFTPNAVISTNGTTVTLAGTLLCYGDVFFSVTATGPVFTPDTVYVTATDGNGTNYSDTYGFYYVQLSDDEYSFSFVINVPAGASDIVDGQIYTLSDMTSDYCYGSDSQNDFQFSSCTLTRNAFGEYHATVIAKNKDVYYVSYEIPNLITEVKDTVYITINDRATCRLTDNTNYGNYFEMEGQDSLADYFFYAHVWHTPSVAGTYRYGGSNNYLYDLRNNEEIVFSNLLPNMVVTGDADSCYAIIHYVGTDSVLYEITFEYSAPVPAVQKTYNASDLVIVRDEYSDLYYDYYGFYLYNFYSYNGEYTFNGTIFNYLEDSPYGTFSTSDGVLSITMNDNYGNGPGSAYGGAINIALNGNVPTITGSALFYGDTEFTYNVTGAPIVTYVAHAYAYPPEGGTVTPDSASVTNSGDVTFTAAAASNYRFVRWSDGETAYSRTVNVTSDTSVTAYFEPLRSDTTSYCVDDVPLYGIGYEATEDYYQAVKINSGVYQNGDSIRSILYYDYNQTPADLYFFTGENEPDTLLFTQPISMTGGRAWASVRLDAPVACPVDQNLWIVIRGKANRYYVACAPYTANPDGCYISYNGTYWYPIVQEGWEVTWMIKAVTTMPADSAVYSVVANAEPESYGYVIPDSVSAPAGSNVRLTANANSAYRFTQWSDGETSYTRTIPVTGDTSLAAEFESIVDDDVISYSTGEFIEGIGNGGGIYWGIKLDPAVLSSDRQLTAISYYLNEYQSDGIYAYIFSGGDKAPLNYLAYVELTQDYTYAWNTVQLPSPVACDNQPLWIIFYCNSSSYPASYSQYTANPNGSYISWNNGYDYYNAIDFGYEASWMIKAIFDDAPKPTVVVPQSETICQGTPYIWRGKVLTEAGVYRDTLHTEYSVDTVYELTLDMNPSYLFSEIQSICQGNSYVWRGRVCTTTGVYDDTLTTVSGCDSIFRLNLNVGTVYLITESESICNQDAYYWHGRVLTESGIYYDSLLTETGCDLVFQLTLTVNTAFISDESVSICSGEYYRWRGRDISVPGIYTDSFKTDIGCDSVFRLTLTVTPKYYIIESETLCQGNTLSWHGRLITAAGTYFDSLSTVAGCDSVHELTVTVYPSYRFESYDTICQGESYYFRGRIITLPGVYFDTLQTILGCDSIFMLTLTVNPTYQIETFETICQGETFNWRGRNLTASGIYYDSLLTSSGCDSVFRLNLTVNPTYFLSEVDSVFDIELPYIWNGRYITESGFYSDTMRSVAGCDSVCELTLYVLPSHIDAPVNVVANMTALRQITFEWQKAPTTLSDDFTYVVRRADGAFDPEDYISSAVNTSDTFCVLNTVYYSSEYRLYVRSTYMGANSEWSETVINTLPQYPAVTNLQVDDVTESSFVVSWQMGQFATETSWNVVVKDSLGIEVVNRTVKSMIAIVTDLNPASSYTVIVYPKPKSSVWGTPDSVIATTLPVPDAPANVIARMTDSRQITFTWQNDTAKQPNDFTYVVRRCNGAFDPEDYISSSVNTTDTFCVLNSVYYTSEYRIYVRCNFMGAVSEWSEAVITTLPQYPAVSDLLVSDITATSFIVSWQRGQYASENAWNVVVKNPEGTEVVNRTVKNMTARITDLDPATTFTVIVYPKPKSSVWGIPDSVVATTKIVPDAPANLIANMTGLRQITFSWQNDTTRQPNDFTYVVRRSNGAFDPEEYLSSAVNTSDTFCILNSVYYSSEYHLYVRCNLDGIPSSWSEVAINTLAQYPAVSNLQVNDVTESTFVVTWDRGQYASESAWNVVIKDDEGNEVVNRTVKKMTTNATNLNPATPYTVIVYPKPKSSVWGTPDSVNVTTMALQPANVIANMTGLRQITFSWQNDSTLQPNEFTYVVRKSNGGFDPEEYLSSAVQTTDTFCILNSVYYSSEYHFYVRYSSGDIHSAWSEVAINTLPQYPAVSNLQVSDITGSSFVVTWERGQFASETQWNVTIMDSLGNKVVNRTVKKMTTTATNLDRAATYTVIVTPKISAKIFGEPDTVLASTKAVTLAPVNVIANMTALRQITFEWQNGSEAQDDNFTYVVRRSSESFDPEDYLSSAVSTADTFCILNSVYYSSEYRLYVRCTHDGVNSVWSEVDITTLPQYPAVKNLRYENVTQNSFQVLWERGDFASETSWNVVLKSEDGTTLLSRTVKNPTTTFKGLNASTTYSVVVYPRPKSGVLGTSDSIYVTTADAPESAPISNEEFISENVISADAFVNMSRLYVENLAEGTHVTIIDAAGRMLYSADADNTHLEFDLTLRGVYMVVLRGKQEQVLNVVY